MTKENLLKELVFHRIKNKTKFFLKNPEISSKHKLE